MRPPLQVPVVFGHWLIDGNRLVCHLPRKKVTINAPKKLLISVMKGCDGSRSWADVLGLLKVNWDTSALVPFMQALVQDGVLVEASLLWAHWADVAQLPTMALTAASNEVISELHQVAQARLLPGLGTLAKGIGAGHYTLSQTLGKRESTRTFDDKPISVECLCSVLWAAHGVTRVDETGAVALRRTIASGGNMHSARWFVVVLRELLFEEAKAQRVAPGIYEARFYKLGGASLHKMKGDAVSAYRCLQDPRILRFASALILPVYELSVPAQKYGNRATLYAVMESGQALQNAQLMACELGASGLLRGDTVAHESLRMLDLKNGPKHWLALPAMVVGAKPTPEQVKQQQLENALTITPQLRLADDSFAFASFFAAAGHPLSAASGRSRDPKIALTKAEAEGWERLAWASPLDIKLARFQVGRFRDVENPLDPNTIVAYSKRQYERMDFPFIPFSVRRRYLWVSAIAIESGKTRSVLADCAYACAALPARFQNSLFTNTSTSGMAAGVSLDDALCRATLELIERDAFVCAWLNRKAPPVVKSASLPGTTALRIKALMRAGFWVVVSDISTPWAPVMSVFAQSDQPPFTAITAAADFSAESALCKALDEMEGRIAHAQTFAIPIASDKRPMRQIERYYRSRRSYKKADFYVCTNDAKVFNAVGIQACPNWGQLQSRIFQQKLDLLSIDMTPNNAVIEQGRVPLRIVRAVIPGLLPIWFQKGAQPEGMSQRAARSVAADWPSSSRFQIHPFT
jgi:ribosomal protein S12 methylthiotransferase accessory factor